MVRVLQTICVLEAVVAQSLVVVVSQCCDARVLQMIFAVSKAVA